MYMKLEDSAIKGDDTFLENILGFTSDEPGDFI